MTNTLDPPPSVIASWPKPNYVDPPTRGNGLFILSIVLASLAIVIITCRTYSRLFITRAFGSDDAFALVALIFAIPLAVLIMIGNKVYESGHHIWDIPPNLYEPHRKNVWFSEVCYIVAASCVKISVLLFYRRLSVTFTRVFLWATWIGIVYNILYMVGFLLCLFLFCRPLNAYWRSFNPTWALEHAGQYQCISEHISLPLSCALSVFGDLCSTLIPLILIRSMSKTFRQKVQLYMLFSLGFLVVAAGIVRTVYNYKVLNTDYDFTWILFDCWIWTEVELFVAICAASAPALKPFIRHFLVEPTGRTISSVKRASHSFGRPAHTSRESSDRRDSDRPLRHAPSYTKEPFYTGAHDLDMEVGHDNQHMSEHRNSWISGGFTLVDHNGQVHAAPQFNSVGDEKNITALPAMSNRPRLDSSATLRSVPSSIDQHYPIQATYLPAMPTSPMSPRAHPPPAYEQADQQHQHEHPASQTTILRTSDQRAYEVPEEPIPPPGTAITTDERHPAPLPPPPPPPSSPSRPMRTGSRSKRTPDNRSSWLDV